MTKNGFIYALKASGCLYHNGQTYYEENELIRTFEDMEMFEEDEALSQEPCTYVQERIELLRMFAEMEDFDFIREMSSEQLWKLMLIASMVLDVEKEKRDKE